MCRIMLNCIVRMFEGTFSLDVAKTITYCYDVLLSEFVYFY